MTIRPYTGWDGDAAGPRAGTEKFIDIVEFLSSGGLWKNGGWNVRTMRGKTNPSVHGTGRALDLSWRGGSYGGYGNYAQASEWFDFFVRYADELHIEAVFDYYPEPYGRGYKCDRDAVRVYTSRAFSGAPGGDWFHIEIAPAHADDPDFYDQAFHDIFSNLELVAPDKPEKSPVPDNPEPEDYPGHVIDYGHKHADEVMAIQHALGEIAVDGDFGPVTEGAVMAFQEANGLEVDGIVGPKTWAALFTHKVEGRPYPGQPVQQGSKGDDVRAIQAIVDTYVDGDFGPVTDAAVRLWQSHEGLVDDGIVGPKTWAKMFGVHVPEAAPAPAGIPFPGPPDIKVGSEDYESVEMIQAKVGAVVDGLYGPETRQKVRDWQARHSLNADGMVGPRTWAKMFG